MCHGGGGLRFAADFENQQLGSRKREGSPALPGVWSRANHLIRLSDVLRPSSGWGR